jgi:Ca-activated chloride channel family protein
MFVPAVAFATVSEGRLTARREKIDIPLEHTDVKIHVVGQLAEVSVEQRFHNPYDRKIDAVYLFPLPTGAAVHDLQMVSNGHVVRGAIALREEARKKYVAAQQKGQVAALLTEQRPNLFTQEVANLEPEARLSVRLHYVQSLEYDHGYQIVFPMVAAPRYMPKSNPEIQPAVLPPGVRSSHEISVAVDLDPGVGLASLESPSHHMVVNHNHLELAPGDTIPNKDFILRWEVAGATPQLALMAHKDGAQGSFFLLAQPPDSAPDEAVAPRELIFVVDTSSSMAGRPLEKARELVRRSLATLRAQDTFQIVRFDDDASALGPRLLAPKDKNIRWALEWLNALPASGTTEMMGGLHAALSLPHDARRLRVVVLLTDGYLGNEDEVLAMAGRELGAARLFSFGVGSAVNRYLLEELAQLGHGAADVVRPDEDTARAVEHFRARIDRPLLTDVTVDWGGLAVKDVTPLRDLFAGQPLVIAGHYDTPGKSIVTVRATQAERKVSFPLAVELPERDASFPQVPLVWARARVAELERRLVRGEDEKIAGEIRTLALRYGILTRYTAFVAVDEASHTRGASQKVAVPVEIPEGLGAISSGGVGYGYGASYGMALTSHKVYAPEVVASVAYVVRGHLDASMIRRVIHSHMNQVRFCYEKELQKLPSFGGRLELRFVIEASGKVSAAEIATSTMSNQAVQSCVADVFRSLEFPAVEGGGLVQVNYPLIFKPGDSE